MKTKRLKLKWPNAAHKPFARWSAQRHTLLKKIAYTSVLLSYTTNGIPGVTTILEQVIILRISLWRAFFKNPFVDCDEGVEAGEDDIEPNTPQEVKVWITFTTIEMRSMSKFILEFQGDMCWSSSLNSDATLIGCAHAELRTDDLVEPPHGLH